MDVIQKAKMEKWLRERESIEDLYEIATMVWEERIRRLREEDAKHGLTATHRPGRKTPTI